MATTNKWQAIQNLWSSFNLPAYDENTVPDSAEMPYITYQASVDGFEKLVPLTASLWYKSNSWAEISAKALEIETAIRSMAGTAPRIDGGRIRVWIGDTTFAQRMPEDDDKVRRIVLNIMAEFMTK